MQTVPQGYIYPTIGLMPKTFTIQKECIQSANVQHRSYRSYICGTSSQSVSCVTLIVLLLLLVCENVTTLFARRR